MARAPVVVEVSSVNDRDGQVVRGVGEEFARAIAEQAREGSLSSWQLASVTTGEYGRTRLDTIVAVFVSWREARQ